MEVVGEPDQEAARDVRDEIVGECGGDSGGAGQQVGRHQDGQAAVRVRHQAEEQAAHDGAGEEHGLSEVRPPVVVAYPISLHFNAFQCSPYFYSTNYYFMQLGFVEKSIRNFNN